MADIQKLQQNLEANGFRTSCFDTAEEACAYLNGQLDSATIGFGGSVTVRDMGLYDQLKKHNTCLWHWDIESGVTPAQANTASVYICSLNGVAETGELINIDGAGNRLAAALFNLDRLYFIIGENKIEPDYDAALWRARNIAAPLNARRLERKTPCAVGELKCHNCASPERICSAQTVYWKKPSSIPTAEVIIIRQTLGF